MFKKYLHLQPAGIQLALFLFLWALFFLLFGFLQPLLIKSFLGVGVLPNDYESELLANPLNIIYLNAIFALLVFFLPAFLFAYLAHPKPFDYAGLKRPFNNKQWIWIIILALSLVPVLTNIGGWVKTIDLGASAKALNERREAVFNAYFKSGSVKDLFRNLLFLALIPAFCEEFFFRGIIQKFAYTWFKKPWAAILFSGVMFTLMHFTIYEFLPILIAGIILAWIYYITSSLWLSITIHFLNNGIQVLFVFFAFHFPKLEQINQDTLAVWLILGLAIILFCWSVFKLNRLKTPLPINWSVEELPLPH